MAVPTTVKRESYRSSPRKLTRPLPIPTMSIAVRRKLAPARDTRKFNYCKQDEIGFSFYFLQGQNYLLVFLLISLVVLYISVFIVNVHFKQSFSWLNTKRELGRYAIFFLWPFITFKFKIFCFQLIGMEHTRFLSVREHITKQDRDQATDQVIVGEGCVL